ncbi:hypothetical protein EDD15DRAFT_2245910 [Pisolithus albus]|nr:hypothetical protein EDD15DRAFT_2245910 [Pisolithus albus]
MIGHPERFGLSSLTEESDTCGRCPLRVLELGAGTGLVGLSAVKVLIASSTKKDCGATVIATDFYPSVWTISGPTSTKTSPATGVMLL